MYIHNFTVLRLLYLLSYLKFATEALKGTLLSTSLIYSVQVHLS